MLSEKRLCYRKRCNSLDPMNAEAHVCCRCGRHPPRWGPGSRRWPLWRLLLLLLWLLLRRLRLPPRLGALNCSICLRSDVRNSFPIVVAALRLV
jgi:hypothetical protein